MMSIDPIIAVKDVNASSIWYKSIFGFERAHSGDEFAVLRDKNHEIRICLHKWGAHEHPTMKSSNDSNGNGLIIYFRTNNMEKIRRNVRNMGYKVESEIQLNPNSRKKEFSLRDRDGYYITISEFHKYEG